MSTTSGTTTDDRIDVIPNEEDGTVTYVADLDGDAVPPTEWITVATEDLVDLAGKR